MVALSMGRFALPAKVGEEEEKSFETLTLGYEKSH
jgi:hypothetical protein